MTLGRTVYLCLNILLGIFGLILIFNGVRLGFANGEFSAPHVIQLLVLGALSILYVSPFLCIKIRLALRRRSTEKMQDRIIARFAGEK